MLAYPAVESGVMPPRKEVKLASVAPSVTTGLPNAGLVIGAGAVSLGLKVVDADAEPVVHRPVAGWVWSGRAKMGVPSTKDRPNHGRSKLADHLHQGLAKSRTRKRDDVRRGDAGSRNQCLACACRVVRLTTGAERGAADRYAAGLTGRAGVVEQRT